MDALSFMKLNCYECPISEASGYQPCVFEGKCHMTIDDKHIIQAIIRGIWDCGTCKSSTYCFKNESNYGCACDLWLERDKDNG